MVTGEFNMSKFMENCIKIIIADPSKYLADKDFFFIFTN